MALYFDRYAQPEETDGYGVLSYSGPTRPLGRSAPLRSLTSPRRILTSLGALIATRTAVPLSGKTWMAISLPPVCVFHYAFI